MKVLSADEVAIRIHLENAIPDCGGAKQVAAALQCDEGTVSKLINYSNSPEAWATRRYFKASDVIAFDKLAGFPVMLGKLCDLSGYPLPVKAEPRVAAEGPANHLCELTKEFSEVALALSDAMRTGSVSINVRRRVISEGLDVINRMRDLLAEMERGIALDGAPALKAVHS